MRELTVAETAQTNGGIPIFIALPAGYIARRYGRRIVGGAIGAVAGWLSE
ncbi:MULTISPECIES: hypothetical protein [Pseudoalteromonas]|nr:MULTISPECIES: hypothetical protein [Pseudoalteromonas]MBR8845602.1 hypothetical protein [Pseudoalteromonas sp. JC3]QUI72599.1 hypothetical protein GSF13_24085 [Pseudoalteromonas sp. M8]UDM60054.1 hypothetical protein KIJ96_09260 [Pseudoalteromonas piscicida]WJE08811.1 hypothetical protein QSH61_18450 [Pseudoalteromonas sp. JC3]